MSKQDTRPDYYKYEVGDKTILVVKIGEGYTRVGAKLKERAVFYEHAGELCARSKAEFNRMFKQVKI